jgi:hypothetical protein
MASTIQKTGSYILMVRDCNMDKRQGVKTHSPRQASSHLNPVPYESQYVG